MPPTAESKTAAVIDVGSNTIKLLVARGAPAGIGRIHARTLEARLGAGLGRERPRLAPDSLARGIDAVRTLAAEARLHGADVTAVVATSAVRDAENGREFAAAVTGATGLPLRILSGTDEARLIGRGLRCDPALTAADDLALFDLGGGSLEALEFRGAAVRCALSLPLGCVRLTERFVANPALPLPETARAPRASRPQCGASGRVSGGARDARSYGGSDGLQRPSPLVVEPAPRRRSGTARGARPLTEPHCRSRASRRAAAPRALRTAAKSFGMGARRSNSRPVTGCVSSRCSACNITRAGMTLRRGSGFQP